MKWISGIIRAGLFSLIVSCSGGDSPGGGDPDPQPKPAPRAATLVFPENNSECNEGEIVSAEQSRVTFEWNIAQNTDSYDVLLTNLNTNTSSTVSTSINEAAIVIQRGTPYQWSVTSKANGTNETAMSQSWRFYNSGEGIANYAPFPAVAVSPPRGATVTSSGTVMLQWEGSDIDDDLVEYTVYFDTTSDPDTLLETLTENSLAANVTPGQGIVYFWRVLSRDAFGNTSLSEIFQFRVQ